LFDITVQTYREFKQFHWPPDDSEGVKVHLSLDGTILDNTMLTPIVRPTHWAILFVCII